jgi:ERCC4-type nuclease
MNSPNVNVEGTKYFVLGISKVTFSPLTKKIGIRSGYFLRKRSISSDLTDGVLISSLKIEKYFRLGMILDTREHDLITLLADANPEVKQLPVGDIWIGDLIIERKSVKDLEASILDGRYREQRGRILAHCQENAVKPLYIIEGGLSSHTGRLTTSAIMKFINRLVFHYNMPVVQTGSLKETADLLRAIVEQQQEKPESLQMKTDLVKVADGLHVQKKVNAQDPRQFSIASLSQCPGVSVKMAEALVTTFGSLKGVMEAPVKDIENVKVGTRKVGPVVSKRLHELLKQ